MAVQYCNYDIKGTLAVAGTSTFTGAATFSSSINMSDNEPINYGGQTMFTHTGSITRIGDNSSSSVLSISSGTATFAGNTSALVVVSRDNMFVDAGQLYIGAGNSSTDNTFRQVVNTGAGSFKLQKRISGTFTDVLGFDNLQNATFAGDITSVGLTVDYTGNRTGDAGILVTNDASDWGIKVDKDGTADYGILSQTDGENAIVVRNASGVNKIQLQGDGDGDFSGNVSVGGSTTSYLESRYDTSSQYSSRLSFRGLQLGNNGSNRIISGRTSVGGSLAFYVNNTNDGLQNTPDGNLALTLATSGDATFAQDLTVSGGDITLGGTGRIQGIDTVSASTDAANKLYVDNAVGGVPGESYINAATFSTSTGIITGTGVGSAGFTVDIDGRYPIGNVALQPFFIDLQQNPVGTTYGDGVSAVPTYYFGQKAGDNDAMKFYAESAATNDITAVWEINDDLEAGLTWLFRNKKTYSPYTATDALKINGDGDITVGKDLTITGGDITLSGTGRIQGVDTVSASTDAANKAYVDAHVSPAGTYLPLVGGTMSGAINMGDNDIDGIDELKFSSGTKLGDVGGTNYMRLTYANSGNGGIQLYDNDGHLQGYLYGDGGVTSSFGLLDGTGSWAVRCLENQYVELRYDDAIKLRTSTTGIAVTGNASATGDLLLTTAGSKVQITGSGYVGADDNLFLGTATSGTDHTYIGDSSRNVSIYNNAVFTVESGDVRLLGTGRIQGVDTVSVGTDAANKTYVDAQIATIPSGLNFQGNWNASTNSPTLASGTGTPGFYYNVSVAGSTNLDGETDWQIGDWAVFVEAGATDKWEKIDNTSALTGVGANNQVSLWGGTNTLEGSTALTFTGGDLYVTGDGNSNNWYSAYQDTITAFSDSGSSTITLTLTQRDGGTLTTSFSNPQGTVTGTGTNDALPMWNSAGTGIEDSPFAMGNADGYSSNTDLIIKSSIAHHGNLTTYFGFINTNTFRVTLNNAPYITSTVADTYFAHAVRVGATNGVGIYSSNPANIVRITESNSNIKISTIPNATSDTDKFLVSDSGEVKYRTGAQVLSDIGAASSGSLGNYLPLTGGTLTGTLVIDTAAGAEKMSLYNENNTAPIADSFTGNTSKSYILFGVVTGSNDPGFIMHESSVTETNEGVLHLCPSDDNTGTDYVSIHGTNDPDVIKLYTSGLIETENLQLQLKSGLNDVYVNDGLLVQSAGTFGGNLSVNGSNITLNGAYPRFNMYSTDAGEDDYSIINNNGIFGIYNDTEAFFPFSLAETTGNATFAGTIGSGAITSTGSIITSSSSGVIQTPKISMEADGTLDWGAIRDYGTLTWDTGYALIRGQSGKGLKFGTNGSTLALTLDTSQNATFAGSATIETGINLESGVLVIKNATTDSNGLRLFQDSSDASKIYNNYNGTLQLGVNNTTSLTLGSSQTATFAGNVTMLQTSGNNTLTIDSSGGGAPVIYFKDPTRTWGQFVASGDLYFKNETTNVVTLLLSGSNATFAGDITVSGGDITLSGTGRIQGIDTVSAGTDAANKDYVDTAVAGSGSGTVTGVSSATTSQLTVSQSSPAPALSIVTAAVANGGTALATGNQIYDWGVAAFAPIVSGGYLPLSGGTMTGNTKHNDDVFSYWGNSDDLSIQHNNSGQFAQIKNYTGDLYFTNSAGGKDIIFQANNATSGTETYLTLDGSSRSIVVTAPLGVYHNDGIAARFGDSGDLQIYHDGSNSYIKEGGTGELIISSGTVLRLRSDASPTGEEYINCTRDGAVALFHNNVEKFHTSSSGVDVLGDLTVDTTAVIDGAATINGQLNQNGDIKLGPSASIVLDDTPTGQTTSGSGTIVEWSVSVSTTAGNLYVVKTDGGWTTADADSEAKSTAMAAIALGGNATSGMLLQGFFYKAGHGFALGSPLYISNTAGAFSNSRPTGTGDYVRIIGYATSANYIYFDPDKTWVKID